MTEKADKGAARQSLWRKRAKRLVALAREAQFELTAKTLRYAALVAVMTEAELADFNARIKKDHAERRARLRAGNAAEPPSSDSNPAESQRKP